MERGLRASESSPLGLCGLAGEVPPAQVPPLDLAPDGSLGALGVGGLCLLAYFLFTDFGFSLFWPLIPTNEWVGLGCQKRNPQETWIHSNLAGFTHPLHQGRAASKKPNIWSQEAASRALRLSSPFPSKGLQDSFRKGQGEARDDSMILISYFFCISASFRAYI